MWGVGFVFACFLRDCCGAYFSFWVGDACMGCLKWLQRFGGETFADNYYQMFRKLARVGVD